MTKTLKTDIALGVGILVLALLATGARSQGWIDDDTTTRIVLCATGLMVAFFGNRMPKAWANDATARRVTRVGGWAMALSGLVYAALWAFAPFNVALMGGCGAIILGIAVTAGYCLSVRNKARAT